MAATALWLIIALILRLNKFSACVEPCTGQQAWSIVVFMVDNSFVIIQ